MRSALSTWCLIQAGVAFGLVVVPCGAVQAQSASSQNASSSSSSEASEQTEILIGGQAAPVLRGFYTGDYMDGQSEGADAPQPTSRIDYPVGPVAAQAPMQGGEGEVETLDTYAPLGLSVGAFRLYPSISFYAHGTDNLDYGNPGKASQNGRVAVDLEARSNWSRHQLDLSAHGDLKRYHKPEGRDADHSLSVDGDLRLDLSDQTDLALKAGLSQERESASDVELRASGGAASIQTSLSASLQLDHDAGAWAIQLRGGFNDERYDEESSRDYRTYSAGGRLGYRITDRVKPFVDVELSRKRYNSGASDLSGDTLRGSLGVEFTQGDIWSGEASVGYLVWAPETSSIEDDAVLFANASLTWSPNVLWTITAGLDTSLTSTSTTARSVATRSASLGIDYQIRRSLLLTADSSLSLEQYYGSGREDWVFDGSVGAEYSFNRFVKATAKAGHERRDSSLSGESYQSNFVEFGLTLQR